MNKRIKMSEETKQKISLTQKCKHHSPKTEFKKGRISERKGIPFYKIREENHGRYAKKIEEEII